MKESEIQKAIMDYLRLKKCLVFKHRSVGIMKPNGSYIPLPAGEKGISDIIGLTPEGRFLAVEVKKPGGKATPEQLDFLERVRNKKGIAILAYSLNEVMKDTYFTK